MIGRRFDEVACEWKMGEEKENVQNVCIAWVGASTLSVYVCICKVTTL